MKIGHFVGVNWKAGKVCTNSNVLMLEEFMAAKDITDPQDVMGPFESPERARAFQQRVANFFRRWERDRKTRDTVPAVTLMDLVHQNQI